MFGLTILLKVPTPYMRAPHWTSCRTWNVGLEVFGRLGVRVFGEQLSPDLAGQPTPAAVAARAGLASGTPAASGAVAPAIRPRMARAPRGPSLLRCVWGDRVRLWNCGTTVSHHRAFMFSGKPPS